MKSILLSVGVVLAAALSVNVATIRGAGAPGVNDVPAKPTFTKDVLPIFQKSCQSCHRPGQMAPFSLLTYEDARPWARSIKQKVETRYMPPWHLDKTIGEYDPDPSLSDDQIATITTWVDGGAPKGDPKDAPPAVKWPADNTWQFGEEPDVLFNSPAFDVPASSPDAYPEPEIASGMTEDRYIKWIQVLPPTPTVTHHVLVFSVAGPPTSANARGASDTTSIFIRGFPTMLTEFARGNDGDIFSENESKLLKKDSTIRFQIHYHPNGKTAVKGDSVKVGIKFFPKGYQPKHVVQTMALASPTTLAIAPGDPNSRSDSYFTLQQPTRLVSYQPHMHYRGKRMVLEAILPTGQVETLTDVNRFVWTWQITYPYKHQPAFPKGTVLHSIAYHDNSAANKENPDPSAFIGWGDRTVDEMNIGWLDFYQISDQEYADLQKQQGTRTTAQRP
jgi:mono/diheme cytochrome c family protein